MSRDTSKQRVVVRQIRTADVELQDLGLAWPDLGLDGSQLAPADNLVPSCAPCNPAKGDDKLLMYMLRRDA
ncbi:hypothetical protein ENSA5_39640 [Enhygromyxa salina]|uniref:Uncharacterized protein n=1 Tax=Enhygromyxa salina TaxID=215803 RepID=A0A2S9XR90_9BACT|nr:hypothetical protein [Enhygromyxa salina]PRP95379.1 hypothetical protein ENSA5_39640 [Enhygromyxa salina]